MLLYHISDRITDPPVKTFIPKIPISAANFENQTIPRICFAQDIKCCIQATGYNFEIGDKIMVYVLNTKDITPSNLWTPEELTKKQYVPDADLNQEYWVTETITLIGNTYTITDIVKTTIKQKNQIYPIITHLTLHKIKKGAEICGTL